MCGMAAGYRDLADVIRSHIRDGHLPPGSPMPGIRALSDRHGVSIQTAANAIRHLAGEGWVITGHGRVTTVADPLPADPPTSSTLASEIEQLRARTEQLEQRMDDLEQRIDTPPNAPS